MSPDAVVVASFLATAVRNGVPLLFGTMGESIIEKSGSLNLGVEGMMAVGSITGYLIGCACNSLFMALFGAFLGAGLCGLLFAFLTVTLKANQNVTGLTITIFGLGLYQYIGETKHDILMTYPDMTEKLMDAISLKPIPGLSEIPFIGEIFFNQGIITYLAVIIAVILWIYLKHTKSGLQMRAIGENPGAADAVGIKVDRKKYFNIILGSGITGLGGLYLGMVMFDGMWSEAWINGYGWISIALVIFANWNPLRATLGSFFFGILLILDIWKGNLIGAFPGLAWMSQIPSEVYEMLPFIITALVLIFTSMSKRSRSGSPAALGINYYREDR